MLVVGLIFTIILARLIMNAAAPYNWGGVVQLGIFAILIALCFLVYKKRLCAYRYTLYYKEPPQGELDAFGEPVKNPFPTGTLVAERMVGNKTKSAEVILPGEMLLLAGPQSASIGVIPGAQERGKSKKLHPAVLTTGSRKTAHSLVFKHDGNFYRLIFHPSAEMVELLDAIIAAVREA